MLNLLDTVGVDIEVALPYCFCLKLFGIDVHHQYPGDIVNQRNKSAHDRDDLRNRTDQFEDLHLVFRQKEVAPKYEFEVLHLICIAAISRSVLRPMERISNPSRKRYIV